MSTLDFSADIDIAAAPADVAAIMFDPMREAEWTGLVTGVDVIDPALAPGARVRRRGRALGREIAWTTVVETVHFPHLLALRVAEGAFSGVVRYEIVRTPAGARARIHAVGDAGGIGALLPASAIEGPARTALTGALTRLKALIEQPASVPASH